MGGAGAGAAGAGVARAAGGLRCDGIQPCCNVPQLFNYQLIDHHDLFIYLLVSRLCLLLVPGAARQETWVARAKEGWPGAQSSKRPSASQVPATTHVLICLLWYVFVYLFMYRVAGGYG